MICSNCKTNVASCQINLDGVIICVCRGCWEALSKRIDNAGMSELVVDKSEDPLYGLCDCGGGWFYHQVGVDGYIVAYE